MSICKTTNSGTIWTRYDLTAGDGLVAAIAVDPDNNSIIYAAGNEGANPRIYKTTSSGATWFNSTAGITGDTIRDIKIDPAHANILFAGNSDGVFKSTNSGTSWSNTGCSEVRAIVVDPDSPNVVYAGTASGVYRSTSGGGGWTAMNDNLDNTDITRMSIYPGTYLYAGTNGSATYRWSRQIGVEEQMVEDGAFDFRVLTNPSCRQAAMSFTLDHGGLVTITIYDIQGRQIKQPVHQDFARGVHYVLWNGYDANNQAVNTGVYFAKCQTRGRISIKKLVVVK